MWQLVRGMPIRTLSCHAHPLHKTFFIHTGQFSIMLYIPHRTGVACRILERLAIVQGLSRGGRSISTSDSRPIWWDIGM